MISSYINYSAQQLSSIYDPMNMGPIDINEATRFENVNPPNIALLAAKYRFTMNMAVSSYKSIGALGLTTNISDPFSIDSYVRRRTLAYEASRPAGFVGDFIRGAAGGIGQFGEQKETGVRASLRRWSEKLEGDDLRNKILDDIQPGFLEKRLLPKKDFISLIDKLDPELKTKIGEDKIYKDFVTRMIKGSQSPDIVSQNKLDDAINKLLGKPSSSTKRYGTITNLNDIIEHRHKRTYSLLNMITGARDKEPFSRRDAILDIINPDPSSSKFAFFSRKGSRITNQTASVVNEGLMSFLQDYDVSLDKDSISNIRDYANLSASRLKKARILKGAAWVGTIATAAIPLAATAVRAYMTVPTKISSTMEKINRMDFGSGEVLHNSSIATERQRALMAIRDSQLNARHIMGNEASFMH